jgi:uncharacterized membrane protein (UPF0182 family)
VLRVVLPIALAAIFIPALVGLTANWLWYQGIGYTAVYATRLTTGLILVLGAGIAAFAVLYSNLRFAQRGLVPDPIVVRLTPVAPQFDITERVRRLSLPVAIVLSVFLAAGAATQWPMVQKFLHRVPFGYTDPIFGRDVGFYVFSLPAITALLGFISSLLVLSLLVVVPLYWLRGDLILPPRRARVEPSASRHLGLLLGLLFLVIAIRTLFVSVPDLLFSTTGPLVGVSYTDFHARRPGLYVAALTALVAAALVITGVVRQKLIFFTAIASALYMGVSVIGTWLIPGAMQRLVVSPNELTKELPFLEHHIAGTRRAWGLDSVVTRELSGDARLSLADIQSNASTIENVRLWDREPLLQTFGQLQEIRTYYDFVSVDDDRYMINGRYRQVLLSPRELNVQSLPTRTFINEHLTFTHGMGLTMSPVNEVTSEGLPVLFIKDLPPQSTVSQKVTRPQIYYGELTSSFAIVNTDQKEFDYPSGDENIFTRYSGRGGVAMNSLWRRVLLSWHFGSLKTLLSQDITPNTRALFHRNILERARKALPMLDFDEDPYLMVTDSGALKWIVDAYTRSAYYPYSQRLGDGTSYMRNSIKIVIDAYHGSIDTYVVDPSDPLVRAWSGVFPGLFKPLSAMPDDIHRHLRYPQLLYQAQTSLYGTYHMNDPEQFYHREDQWQIPASDLGDQTEPFMRHIIMRLPDEKKAEYIFMVPFTPRGKDNLAAWMVARNDPANYGQLVVYRFPKQSLVYGPRQVVNRINQDTEIARQISLWDQRGSEVIRGDLLVIPIEESLMYVQPLYLRAQGGRIPELKRVVVAYQNRVMMAETLDDALVRLFGEAAEDIAENAVDSGLGAADSTAATPGPAQSNGFASLLRQARMHYERALEAQRAGDWATYGQELDTLGSILRRAGTPAPTPR